MLSRRSGSSSLGQTFEVTDGNYTGAEPSHLKTNYPRGNELGSEARFRDERSFQVMQIECVCDLRLTFLLNINSRCRLLWSSDSMHGFCGLRGKIRPSPSLRESSELSWSGIMSTPSFSSASTARKYLDFYTNTLTPPSLMAENKVVSSIAVAGVKSVSTAYQNSKGFLVYTAVRKIYMLRYLSHLVINTNNY